MPPYGCGDPKYYNIMRNAVRCLKENGSLGHGFECFNYFFPQEIEDEFLVFSEEGLSAEAKWKYLTLPELQSFLCNRIQQGYAFPLNPKWILCDKGWKHVYDQMHANSSPQVKTALDVWYPPESGIRELIEVVHQRHPNGFCQQMLSQNSTGFEERRAMDRSEEELKRHMTLQRAKFATDALDHLQILPRHHCYESLS